LLSVTAIALFAGAGAFATGAGFGSGLGSGFAVDGGAAGGGVSVGSFFSALGDFSTGEDFSALDAPDMLEDGDDSVAGSGEIGVAGGAGDVAFALAERETGGGFIQSRTYGTATAPNTPRTIRTRTTRNHVAAKMERGGTSS
jgi:hypothetical protein